MENPAGAVDGFVTFVQPLRLFQVRQRGHILHVGTRAPYGKLAVDAHQAPPLSIPHGSVPCLQSKNALAACDDGGVDVMLFIRG